MRSINSKAFIIGLIIVQSLFSQTISVKDTLRLRKNKTRYRLTNNFIFPESIEFLINGEEVRADSVDFINGIIYWENRYEKPVNVLVEYDAIERDLPLSIGPIWKNFPTLDSIMSKNTIPKSYFHQKINMQDESLYTSGTFNRQINLSTQGMSEFSGGLHLNISGELDNNIMLSAVLSDQDMILQPEGNTRNLEDIEQVYISMQHPNFSLDAGDIEYNNKYDKLINIRRKVIGINNNFKYKNFTGNALIASTRGKYMSTDIVGFDGVQGPYRLTSKEGSKDISLISGSEKVWLDGGMMIRGANYDYVIDYSLAEITFTAKHLIRFDSDIFVEYEYIDGQYSQKIISGSYQSKVSENFNIVAGVIREKDNTNNLSSDSELYQNIAAGDASDLIIYGAVEDTSGSYYLDGEVYRYDPDFMQTGYKRYRVTFTFDVKGKYEKIISNKGKVYYQYYEHGNSSVNKDLYSPYHRINAPRSKDLFYAKGNYNLGNKISFATHFSRSSLDNNILSGMNASDKGGLYEVSFKIDSIETGSITYAISGGNQFREKDYSSFGLDRNVRFKRFWDLDSIGILNERESALRFFLNIEKFSSTLIEFSSLNIGDLKKEKIKLDHKVDNGIFEGTSLKHQQVSSSSGVYKYTDGIINLHSGFLRPFFRFQEERKPGSINYSVFGSGISYQKENKSIKLGIDRREDNYLASIDNESVDKHSEDLISSLQYVNQNRTGWRNNLILKQRIKRFDNSVDNLNYLLGRIKLSYKKPERPLYFELNASTERTQNENYSIVYDSIGVGLGDYRYDNNFNTFIRDPNGAYVGYSVPTGDRIDMININGFQRLVFDFEKLKGSPSLRLKMDTSYDYSGTKFDFNGFIEPIISDTTLYRSYMHNMIEIDWKQNRSMDRVRAYNIFSYDLQGYDPRGNELLKHLESGIDYHSSISTNTNLKITGFYHNKDIESGFARIRNRNVYGSWYEMSLSTKNRRNIDSEISIKYGEDRGRFYLNKFSAYGIGFEYKGRLYLGESGSLHSNVIWQKNNERSDIRILPPEALNGFTIGENISVSTRVNYFFNKDMSFSLSIGYINNDRYNNLTTVLGEFRAYL